VRAAGLLLTWPRVRNYAILFGVETAET